MGADARRRRDARARLGASGRPRDHVRRRGAVEDRAGDRRRAAGDERTRLRGGRRARPADDDRHGRPGPRLRRAAIGRRARGHRCGPRESGGSQVATVGLGSNLLAADDGVDMLVLRLAGELAEARTDGTMLAAGGGATNAVCLHRARAAALGGFEFACAIPGTAGGGVWMNAGAYGSDWSAIVDRALVATADGSGLAHAGRARASPTGTRASGTARSSRRSSTSSSRATRRDPRRPSAISSIAARRPSRRRSARSAPSSRTRRVSSAPGAMLEACGLKGHRDRRRADLAEARELHRERGRRDDGRLPGADGRGPPPRARAVRRRARARGRAARRDRRRLTARRRPDGGRRKEPRGHRGTSRTWIASPCADGGSVVAPLPRRIAGERLDLPRLVPSGRSLGIAFLIVVGAARRLARRPRDGRVRRPHVDVGGAPPGVASQVRKALAPTRGTSLLKVDLDAVAAGRGGAPDRRERPLRPRVSPHASRRRRARAPVARSCARAPTPTSSPRAAG